MEKAGIRYIKTPGEFFNLLFSAIAASFGMLSPGYRKSISTHFAERIMLAVSGVNECAYCSWLHTRTALEKGMSDEEIRGLLDGSFESVTGHESVAIFYAQHWAESRGNPSPDARQRVVDYYGEKVTMYIERTMKVVTLGNLCSNTVYAKREGMVDNTSACFMITYILSMPIAYGIKKSSGVAN